MKYEDVLAMIKNRGGYIRSRELRMLGVHPSMLPSMERDGLLVRIKRGLYALPENQAGDERLEALMAVPDSILCLGTAMSIHNIGTWEPPTIYIAIPKGRKVKTPEHLPATIVHFAAETFTLGVVEIGLPAGMLRVYNAERTICDLFRLRHRYGSDLAAGGLREYLKRSSRNLPLLLEYAERLKISGPLRRSLEALVG